MGPRGAACRKWHIPDAGEVSQCGGHVIGADCERPLGQQRGDVTIVARWLLSGTRWKTESEASPIGRSPVWVENNTFLIPISDVERPTQPYFRVESAYGWHQKAQEKSAALCSSKSVGPETRLDKAGCAILAVLGATTLHPLLTPSVIHTAIDSVAVHTHHDRRKVSGAKRPPLTEPTRTADMSLYASVLSSKITNSASTEDTVEHELPPSVDKGKGKARAVEPG